MGLSFNLCVAWNGIVGLNESIVRFWFMKLSRGMFEVAVVIPVICDLSMYCVLEDVSLCVEGNLLM